MTAPSGKRGSTRAAPRRRVLWSALLMVAAFGAVGALLALTIRRRGLPLGVSALLIALSVLQGTGAAVTALQGMRAPECQPPAFSPPEQAAAHTRRDDTAWVSVRQVLSAGPTGLALLYARLQGADVCRFAPNGNLIARMDSGYARAGTMVGHLFLTYPRPDLTYEDLLPLTRHEARHADQWAVTTVLAGPWAFPGVYIMDEALAPGAHNHFERHAGLTDGGYTVPDRPSRTTGRLAIGLLVLIPLLYARRAVHHRRPRPSLSHYSP